MQEQNGDGGLNERGLKPFAHSGWVADPEQTEMVELEGETYNTLYDTLADWNAVLKEIEHELERLDR